MPDSDVARFASRNHVRWPCLLVSIPGTIGGGLTMNAGCYGSEFKDVLISARRWTEQVPSMRLPRKKWA